MSRVRRDRFTAVRRRILLLGSLLIAAPRLRAQERGAVALDAALSGLGATARILVIGAHPDDEDTQLLTWLARGRQVETADLSLTRVDAVPDTAEELPYGISPDGKVRAVTRADGFIVAEKHCASCGKRWKKKWRIRAPGDEFARPVVTDRRVFYGTTDNRVFAVKRRNGHRVWAADIPGRVVRPLELVRVQAPPELVARGKSKGSSLWLDLILVVPASGRTLIALDARNGERVASFDLEEDEMLVGAPLARDGHVVVARQKYEANDAALLVFRLSPAGPFPPEETAPAAEPQASGGAPASGGAG